MKRWLPVVFFCVIALGLWGVAVHPCGFEFSFRAYLDKRFWQPLSKYEESLGKSFPSESRKESAPFAGMSDAGSNETLQRARDAYREREYGPARTAVEKGLREITEGIEREELLLLDAKIDLREGEGEGGYPAGRDRPRKASRNKESEPRKPLNEELLRRSGEKLREFVRTSQIPAFRSEARGWLARVHYLTKDYPSATKIYLDELSKEDSVFSRESLITSLRILFPYNGSSVRLVDHLEEYFDTPAHALFVVGLVTNPIYSNEEERASMAEAARKTIAVLQKRRDLFGDGAQSEALVLALMRASLYMGDTQSALSYSQWVPENSTTAGKPEFHWMRAACYFLQHEYRAAEAPLLKMYNTRDANFRDRSVAAQALLGVYQKLGRGVDQLHAAFLYYKAEQERQPDSQREGESRYAGGPYYDFLYLPAGGWLFDLPYLLDIQLKDEDLSLYLKRYSKSAKLIKIDSGNRKRSAYEMVEYTLAVRYTRQEKYRKAASIYQRLKAQPRVNRLRRLARLYEEAGNASLSSEQHLEARFAYAAFLEEHSTQIFFNDMLWHGYQRYMFLRGGIGDDLCAGQYFLGEADCQGLTGKERDFFLKQERKVKDEQEERWRAYKILDKVRESAGHSELGNRAAAKALKCLKLINTDRFGRQEEINAAMRRLSNWTRK